MRNLLGFHVSVGEGQKPLIVNVSSWLLVAALFAPSILKITGVVDWSWQWATSPLWIFFSMLIAVTILAGVGYVGYLIFRAIFR
jgi:hypothetical protein